MIQRCARAQSNSTPLLRSAGERDPRPAVQERFADCGDRPGVINFRTEVRAVIDPAQYPLCFRHQMEETEPRAIGWRSSMAKRCSPRGSIRTPSRQVTAGYARLRLGRRDHDRFAQSAGGADERRKARGIDPIVIRDQKFHERSYTRGVGRAILAARGKSATLPRAARMARPTSGHPPDSDPSARDRDDLFEARIAPSESQTGSRRKIPNFTSLGILLRIDNCSSA